MKIFKYLFLILFTSVLFHSDSVYAAVITSYLPTPSGAPLSGGTASINDKPQYTGFRIDQNAQVSKFIWWGLEDINSKQNFNWDLSFYKNTGLLSHDLIYNKTFSYNDLAQNQYLDSFGLSLTDMDGNVFGYNEMQYSYVIPDKLILNEDTDYIVSIKALFNDDEVWSWYTHFVQTDNNYYLGYAFELEGNLLSSPVPTPEPSSIILGLMSISSIFGFRKRNNKP